MSFRGLYQLTDGTFVRTQGEIPKGEPLLKIEVPVDSKGLCGYLNTLIATERGNRVMSEQLALVDEVREEIIAEEKAPIPPPAEPKSDHAEMRRKLALELRGMEIEAIEESILKMKAPDLGRTMAACVERFGQVGREAWQSLRGFLSLHSAAANNYDRGLLMLSLHQIERLSEPKPEPKTYKELNG